MKDGNFSCGPKYWYLFSLFIIGISILTYIAISHKTIIQNETVEIVNLDRYNQMCKIFNISNTMFNYQNFYVNYNMTIQQPNYVCYLKNRHTYNITKEIWYVDNNYNNISLDVNDYFEAYLQYYRTVRLAPESEFGNSSYTITNSIVLPENSFTNWNYLNKYLDRYMGKLICKGCDYDLRKYIINDNHKLYIPQQCYYVVLNHQEFDLIGELVDYGYFTNTTVEKKLPYWVSCYNQDGNLNGTVILNEPGEYIIDKHDYKFTNNITIEMLSSGGGFTIDKNKIVTGSSGEYLKFNMVPYNESFHIKIGKGGLVNKNGEPNSIDSHSVHIILKGGQCGSQTNEQNIFDNISNYTHYPQNIGITKYITNIQSIKDTEPPVDLPCGYGSGINNSGANYNGIAIIRY